MSNENTEKIIESISPHLAALADTSIRDRPLKRRAIEAVKRETLQIKSWSNASVAATPLLAHLVDSLLVCTESEIESVREQTVGILNSFIDKCQQGGIDSSTTNKVLDQCLKRLKDEPTEEIRVVWIDLCTTLTKKLTDNSISVTESEQLMSIIALAGKDGFSEVLQRAAKLITLYAQLQPKSTGYACERMVRLTVPLLVHKHTAVRVLGIKSMESVLIASAKGLHLLFQDDEERQAIVPALIYDPSALVRDTLFTALGKLLCNWSPRDRYQYGARLFPIILAGTFDDLPSIHTRSINCLKQVGLSCTRDLYDAEIIRELPTDDNVSETMGLKHLVHLCFDTSLLQLLVIDFISVRQAILLDSLRLFLSYAQVDDLVKHLKKIVTYLMVVYLKKEQDMSQRVLQVVTDIENILPNADIFLDILLSRLEKKYLAAETNGFPGSLTVMVVLAFLDKIAIGDVTRVKAVLDRPYLQEYIHDNKESLEHLDRIRSSMK